MLPPHYLLPIVFLLLLGSVYLTDVVIVALLDTPSTGYSTAERITWATIVFVSLASNLVLFDYCYALVKQVFP